MRTGEPDAIRLAFHKDWPKPSAVFHLAVLGDFPACQSVGKENVRNQVCNLTNKHGNDTKDDIVNLVLEHFPEVEGRCKNLSFGGDQRGLTVSFNKIHRKLGFEADKTLKEGVEEVANALRVGFIRNPSERRFRKA